MKHGRTVAILVLLMLAVGCGERQRVKVTFLSDPPGGTLYTQDGDLQGPCPMAIWYDLDKEATARGYLDAAGMVVRWPNGPEKKSAELIRITVNGTDRRMIFLQPKDVQEAPTDIAGTEGGKSPDEKQAERQDVTKSQSANTESSEQSEKTLVSRPEEPVVPYKPLAESPSERVLTLSGQQLVLLDWISSNRRGARVEGIRAPSGQGVEFDIYFPTNSPGSCSLSFVSTGTGGRGSLVGTDVRGYDAFALKLTLVSVNGRTRHDPRQEQKLVVGAVIGPTAEGRLSGYEPYTLSLAASERTVTARTAVSTDEIYEIGFHIHALNCEHWDRSGSKIVLIVEPVETNQANPSDSSK